MPYFVDIKDPAALIMQFLHRFDNEVAVFISLKKEKPEPNPARENAEMIAWERELQQQLFMLSGMVLSLRSSLKQPAVSGDTIGLFGWSAGEIAVIHPETTEGTIELKEIQNRIKKYCADALQKILDETPEVPPD